MHSSNANLKYFSNVCCSMSDFQSSLSPLAALGDGWCHKCTQQVYTCASTFQRLALADVECVRRASKPLSLVIVLNADWLAGMITAFPARITGDHDSSSSASEEEKSSSNQVRVRDEEEGDENGNGIENNEDERKKNEICSMLNEFWARRVEVASNDER